MPPAHITPMYGYYMSRCPPRPRVVLLQAALQVQELLSCLADDAFSLDVIISSFGEFRALLHQLLHHLDHAGVSYIASHHKPAPSAKLPALTMLASCTQVVWAAHS
jgi:hypothetical protein